MSATISVVYDPTKAKQGLSDLDKSLKNTAKNTEDLGTKSIKTGTQLDKMAAANTSVATSAKAAVGGVGQFGGVVSAVGGAVGGQVGQFLALGGSLTGAAEAAVGAAGAMGPLGILVAGAAVGVGYLALKWRETAEETAKAEEAAKKAAIETRKYAEERANAMARGQFGLYLDALESSQSLLGEIESIEKRRADAQMVANLSRIDSERTVADLQKEQVALAKIEREELAKYRELASRTDQDAAINERNRAKLQEEHEKRQVRINALKTREKELLEKQKQAEEELHRKRADEAKQEQQRHAERMRQVAEEERRRIASEVAVALAKKAADKKAITDRDAAALQSAFGGGGLSPTGGSFGGAMGGDGSALGGAAGDSVIRGRPKGPLQYGGLAGAVMGMSGATSAMAMNASQATAASPAFYGANLGGPGSRDRLRGGGGASSEVPRLGGLLGEVQGGLRDRDVQEKIAENRQEALAIKQRDERKRATDIARAAGGDLSKRESLDMDRRFAREQTRARRGVFAGDASEAETAKAVGQLGEAEAQRAQQQGKLSQDTLDALREASKLIADQAEIVDDQQRQIEEIKRMNAATQNNMRQRQQRAGRGPG